MTVLKSMVINPFILDHYRFCTVDKEISIDKAAVDLKDNSGKRNKWDTQIHRKLQLEFSSPVFYISL